jgi:hypothetical protein
MAASGEKVVLAEGNEAEAPITAVKIKFLRNY